MNTNIINDVDEAIITTALKAQEQGDQDLATLCAVALGDLSATGRPYTRTEAIEEALRVAGW